jgi:hypothetical protein
MADPIHEEALSVDPAPEHPIPQAAVSRRLGESSIQEQGVLFLGPGEESVQPLRAEAPAPEIQSLEQLGTEQSVLEGPTTGEPRAEQPAAEAEVPPLPTAGVAAVEGSISAVTSIMESSFEEPLAEKTLAETPTSKPGAHDENIDPDVTALIPARPEGAPTEQPAVEPSTTEQLMPEQPASSSRELTAEPVMQVEEELPAWLKEAAQLEESPTELPPLQEPVSPQEDSARAQPSVSAVGRLTTLTREQTPSSTAPHDEPSFDKKIAENPEELPETRSPPTETVPPPAAGTATAQIAEAPDRAMSQPSDLQGRIEQPETQQGVGEQTESPEPGDPTSPIAATTAATSSEAGVFPEWMKELVPPDNMPFPRAAQSLRTEPPQLREDEREELPDWLRESLSGAVTVGVPHATLGPLVKELTPRAERKGWMEESKDLGEHPIPGETLDELTETEGPLAGVRGILPLALGVKDPHTVVRPISKENDGARIFESVLTAAAEGAVGSTPAVEKAARPSWTRRWIYLAVILAALIPFFVPSDLAGLGLKVNNTTPTAKFYDEIQSLAPGSTVLLAFDYDTGQTVELNPAARVVVQDLARRKVNVVALSTLPTGVQIAQTILSEASRQNPGWTSGENYLNAGYLPGGEAGLRALSDHWLPASQEESFASLPLGRRVSSLKDLALAIEFAGSEESLRAWMEQVQPSRQVTFVAAVSAAVEPQARNYLAANQLAAFLRGLGGAAEYELFSNQTGLNVRTVDAQSFSHLVMFGIIVLGNLAFILGQFRKARPSDR